jgi:hypothetical protein
MPQTRPSVWGFNEGPDDYVDRRHLLVVPTPVRRFVNVRSWQAAVPKPHKAVEIALSCRA